MQVEEEPAPAKQFQADGASDSDGSEVHARVHALEQCLICNRNYTKKNPGAHAKTKVHQLALSLLQQAALADED